MNFSYQAQYRYVWLRIVIMRGPVKRVSLGLFPKITFPIMHQWAGDWPVSQTSNKYLIPWCSVHKKQWMFEV